MTTTFHESEVANNLRQALSKSCKKFNTKDNITEYLCTCGYIITEDENTALKVRSIACGF